MLCEKFTILNRNLEKVVIDIFRLLIRKAFVIMNKNEMVVCMLVGGSKLRVRK